MCTISARTHLSSCLVDDEVVKAEMMRQNEILLDIEHIFNACNAHFAKVRRELCARLAEERTHCIALPHLDLPPVSCPVPERVGDFHGFVSRTRILLFPLATDDLNTMNTSFSQR